MAAAAAGVSTHEDLLKILAPRLTEETAANFVRSLSQDHLNQQYAAQHALGLITIPFVFIARIPAALLSDGQRAVWSPLIHSGISVDPNMRFDPRLYDPNWLEKLKEELRQ